MKKADALRFSPVPAEKVVACVGLISDTHMPARCVAFPASTFEVLRGVDIILHAGDVGGERRLIIGKGQLRLADGASKPKSHHF